MPISKGLIPGAEFGSRVARQRSRELEGRWALPLTSEFPVHFVQVSVQTWGGSMSPKPEQAVPSGLGPGSPVWGPICYSLQGTRGRNLVIRVRIAHNKEK